MKKISAIFIFIFVTFLLAAKVAFAQTINVEVSGNGDGSQNTTNVAVQQETIVNQTNQSDITNDVSINTNTGSNNASENSGASQIATGDSNTNVGIANQANNSVANLGNCNQCQNNVNIQNSNNGANSQNTVNAEIGNATAISVLNDARITNNINVSGNTGYNQALRNNGNVSIQSGKIIVNGNLENKANYSEIVVDPRSGQKLTVVNSSNGSNSVNDLNVAISQSLNITKIDREVIENLIDIILNTGGNIADGNNGAISIETGDIDINFSVVNEGNKDFIKVECCKVTPSEGGLPPEPPISPSQQPIVPPPAQPSPSAAGPSEAGPTGPSGPGQVLGLAALPVTGPSNFLVLILFWFVLFASGVFLRYRGERSPPALFFSN